MHQQLAQLAPASHEVTRILRAIDQGSPQAAEELLPLVYDELRTLAACRMARERPGQTLQATALVHEAYLRLVGRPGQHWNGRGHFIAAAAEAMRRILVENARRKRSQKRGGEARRVEWSDLHVATEAADDQILLLHEALGKLEDQEQQAAQLVKLRFFVGLSGRQAAEALGLPERTATRLWAYARAWLLREINRQE